MKTPVLERTSAAKAGWVVAVLMIGWLVFLLLPAPVREEAPQPPAVPVPSSSLTRAGLAEYTDWVGLPEIFAIWADKAEWKEGKTRFAYWHPVMKNYSYHFEATRVGRSYRFKEIPEPSEPGHYWDEGLGEECPIRFYRTSPIVKPDRVFLTPPKGHPDPGEVKLEIPAPSVPAFEIKGTPPDPGSKP